MSIMPHLDPDQSRAVPTLCPPWCIVHIPGDQILHEGDDFAVETNGHGEQGEVHVTIEQPEHHERGLGKPVIRLTEAGDVAMTPGEALELAAQLTHLAYLAMFR